MPPDIVLLFHCLNREAVDSVFLSDTLSLAQLQCVALLSIAAQSLVVLYAHGTNFTIAPVNFFPFVVFSHP